MSFKALDRSWVPDSRCVQPGEDPPDFFPGRGTMPEEYQAIRDFCRACPVRIKCLDFAMRMHEEVGYWGGLSRDERLRLIQLFKIPPRERILVHGTERGYKNGCKCDSCRDAHIVAAQEYRERQVAS